MPPPVPLNQATSLAPGTGVPAGAVLAFTFTAPGVTVNVYASEYDDDGDSDSDGVRFDFRTESPGWNIDLNGFFLDLDGDGGSIRRYGSSSNNMNGGGRDGYDHAVVLGSVGGSDADFRDGFWKLAGISLEDLDGADAGLRATSYGQGSNREGSLKLEDDYDRLFAAIGIDKKTNDADNFDAGDGNVFITWSYTVTNTGNVPLKNVRVTDDNGTPGISTDDFVVVTGISLDVGQSQTFFVASGLHARKVDPDPVDPYYNLATAEGEGVGLVGIVTDTDPSGFFWDAPA